MKSAIASACLFGMVVASVLAADVVEFRKVDYFEVVTKLGKAWRTDRDRPRRTAHSYRP